MGAADIEQLCKASGLAAGDAQIDALWRYLQLLQRWNATYNLTAVRDPGDMLTQHIADCLAIVTPLRRYAAAGGRLLDVGSGGGLPAVVIAALMPEWQVTSVDAVGKKAAFVQQVSAAVPLTNLQSRHARVEQFQAPLFDVIASRAFASLQDFTSLSRHLLKAEGAWMAMKGRKPDAEIAALPRDLNVFHVEQLTVAGLPAARCLVWMRKLQQGGPAPADKLSN